MDRPVKLFDRGSEWDALVRFAGDTRPGATLGLVYGRRRQGKTFLLNAVAEQMGGVLHVALEDLPSRALADLGRTLGRASAAAAPLALSDWSAALDAILELGSHGRPVLVVLDEFPYLVASSPELPSVIQRALGPASAAAQASRTRLVLCGSAISVMSKLLTGTAPLRGRAGLDLIVHPFDYRQAASFWGLERDPELAVMVHAVLGGTPAYRELIRGDIPKSPKGFDAWIARSVLDRASPLAREGAYLLAEEPPITDRALYHSILEAIAEGRTRRGQIAQAVGRRDNELGHPLNVLQELRLVSQEDDALRRRRPSYTITEPIVRFHHAVVRRQAWNLERGMVQAAWREARSTFFSRILGPHFEAFARTWLSRFASAESTGGPLDRVGTTEVQDRSERNTHQVDVVGVQSSGRAVRVAVLGEAKWSSKPLGLDEVRRLEHVRDLLDQRPGVKAEAARLALFSRSGFTSAVTGRRDLLLVDLDRLFHGE